MRHLFISSCLLFCTSVTSVGLAQSASPTSAEIKSAAASYDKGRERFREGSFIEAAEKFEAADDFAPSAPALRLAILARKEAGHLQRAATLAALALQRYPDEEQIAGEAQALLDEVGPSMGQVQVTCDEPCELILNNRIVHGFASESRLLYIGPGSATIRASWSENRTESETVEVVAGETLEVNFSVPEIPVEPVAVVATEPTQNETQSQQADPAQDAPKQGGWHPAVFWTGVGVTAAGGGAIVALGLNAQNNPGKQAVIDNCAPGDVECPEFKEGQKNQMYVNIAIGGTAAVGLFTVITGVWFTDWGGNEGVAYQDGDLSIRPTFAVGDGAVLGASGTF